ncbi:MAG: EscU/YscU/HrcU family type III secretion system export apparatus switch protein [Ferrovibrio sp.]|uniref:EscU/YscU/HrcU family type III secretion system export apparatus switch protein n=1 Tax=Ferrovibrio sp. TaxID=1917215 RepID=UPI00391A6A4D
MAQPPSSPPPDKRAPRSKAVALGYDPKRDEAPRVVASGQGHIADQIVRIALDHGVTVRQDSDLVEILSKLDIDALIPVEAFAAVAEILSYIYRSQGKSLSE